MESIIHYYPGYGIIDRSKKFPFNKKVNVMTTIDSNNSLFIFILYSHIYISSNNCEGLSSIFIIQ